MKFELYPTGARPVNRRLPGKTTFSLRAGGKLFRVRGEFDDVMKFLHRLAPGGKVRELTEALS